MYYRSTQHILRRYLVSSITLLVFILMCGPAFSKINRVSVPKEPELDTIRGVVKPPINATVSSEIQARIDQLPFRDGQRFEEGDTLVEFDCSKYQAELDAAFAEFEAHQKTLENSLELSKLNAIGQLEVEIDRAEAKKALAAIEIAQVSVDRCRIDAPFSGRVIQTMVNQYESVNPYDELLSILDDSHFEIELILPSKALRWIKKETNFKFIIDETGQTYPAIITEIGASVDPVSQTIRVIGEFISTPDRVLAGMSGSAKFPNTQQKKKTKKQRKKKERGKKSAESRKGKQQTTAKR